MVAVIGFHGQGANGDRLADDMGQPDWLDWCPDWQRVFRGDPRLFTEFLRSDGIFEFIAVGYSLGGDFIADLTYYAADLLRGVLVYESPLLSVTRPNSLPIPCMVVWNDYTPFTRKRREGKWYSITRWTQAYPQAQQVFGRLTSHVRLSLSPPWIRHAWDTSLNGIIGQWIGAIT